MPPRVPHPVPRHPPGLGAARPGPARPRPAPRQRGRAAGRPRRGGAGLGGGGRPGGTRACRHVQTRAGTRPPASTCRHTCERTHTCAKCARAAVQTQTRTCKCRLGQGPHSAGKCTHTPVSKQARTGARTCTQRANAHAPHPLPRTRLAPARRAQMQPSPLPNARRALTPIVRVHRCTHALPTRPCDTRTAVPSTSLHVPPHPVPPPRTPAVPRPCHPGATRWAHPGAAAGSRARGGGGGPRSAAAQMSGAGPGCSKQNSCAASHFPAAAAKNSKCREVPAAAVPGGPWRDAARATPLSSRWQRVGAGRAPRGRGRCVTGCRVARLCPRRCGTRGRAWPRSTLVPITGCGGADASIPRASLCRSQAGGCPLPPAAGRGAVTARGRCQQLGRPRQQRPHLQKPSGVSGPRPCPGKTAPELPGPGRPRGGVPRCRCPPPPCAGSRVTGTGGPVLGSRDGMERPWISPPVPRNAGMHRFSAPLLLSTVLSPVPGQTPATRFVCAV